MQAQAAHVSEEVSSLLGVSFCPGQASLHLPTLSLKGHPRFTWPAAFEVVMRWDDRSTTSGSVKFAGFGASRICYTGRCGSRSFAFKFGESLYEQTDNNEFELFHKLLVENLGH